LTASSGTRFGTTLTANVATDIASIPSDPSTPNSVVGVTLYAAGDLFYANSATPSLGVIPASSTTSVFGQAVTPSTPTVLATASSFAGPAGLAVDSQGVLYIAQAAVSYSSPVTGIGIVAPTSTTLFGVACSAGHLANFSFAGLVSAPTGVVTDHAGNAFIANGLARNIVVYPKVSGTLFGQVVTAGVPAILQASLGVHIGAGFAINSSGDLFLADV